MSRLPCLPDVYSSSFKGDNAGSFRPGSNPGPAPTNTCPKHFTKKHPGGILVRCLNNLNWVLFVWSISSCSLSASLTNYQLHSLSLRLGQATLWRKLTSFSLYLPSRSFSGYPQLRAVGQSRNVDRLVEQRLCFQANSYFTTTD